MLLLGVVMVSSLWLLFYCYCYVVPGMVLVMVLRLLFGVVVIMVVSLFLLFSYCRTRVGGRMPLFCVCVCVFHIFLGCCILDANTVCFTHQTVAPVDAQAVRISK